MSCSDPFQCIICFGLLQYGRNKTKAMVILKITFVWVVSLAISCPVLVYGFVDYDNVYQHGHCSPGIRNFRIYGSVFAFYVPLLTMLVTYFLTVRIFRRSRTMRLRYVSGNGRPSSTATHNGNACQNGGVVLKKPTGYSWRNRVFKRRWRPEASTIGQPEEFVSVADLRPLEAMSEHPVVNPTIVSNDGGETRSSSRICNSQHEFQRNVTRGQFSLSYSQPHLPSMSPRRRASAAAAPPRDADIRRAASYLNVLQLESPENDDYASSCVTSLNSLLSRCGETMEGSLTWSEIDAPDMLEKLSLIENEMDECLICRSPSGATSATSDKCKLGEAKKSSRATPEKKTDSGVVPLLPAILVDSGSNDDANDEYHDRSDEYETMRSSNCTTSTNHATELILRNEAAICGCTNDISCSTSLEHLKTSEQFQADDVTDCAARLLTNLELENVAADTSHIMLSENIQTGVDCRCQTSFKSQHRTLLDASYDDVLSRGDLSSSPSELVLEDDANSTNINGTELLPTKDILSISPPILPSLCSSSNSSKASTPFSAEDISCNHAQEVPYFGSCKFSNSNGSCKFSISNGLCRFSNSNGSCKLSNSNERVLLGDQSETTRLLRTPTDDSNHEYRNNANNTSTDSDVTSKSTSNALMSPTNNGNAAKHPRTVAPLCGGSRLRKFFRREGTPHWRPLRFTQLSLHKKKRSETRREFVHISKRMITNERKASKVLGIIVGVFLVLWTPFFVMNILSVACPACMAAMSDSMTSSIVWLGYLSSLANPIIYTMFNTAFRQAFYRILSCRYRRTASSYYNKTGDTMYHSANTRQWSDRRMTQRNVIM